MISHITSPLIKNNKMKTKMEKSKNWLSLPQRLSLISPIIFLKDQSDSSRWSEPTITIGLIVKTQLTMIGQMSHLMISTNSGCVDNKSIQDHPLLIVWRILKHLLRTHLHPPKVIPKHKYSRKVSNVILLYSVPLKTRSNSSLGTVIFWQLQVLKTSKKYLIRSIHRKLRKMLTYSNLIRNACTMLPTTSCKPIAELFMLVNMNIITTRRSSLLKSSLIIWNHDLQILKQVIFLLISPPQNLALVNGKAQRLASSPIGRNNSVNTTS